MNEPDPEQRCQVIDNGFWMINPSNSEQIQRDISDVKEWYIAKHPEYKNKMYDMLAGYGYTADKLYITLGIYVYAETPDFIIGLIEYHYTEN